MLLPLRSFPKNLSNRACIGWRGAMAPKEGSDLETKHKDTELSFNDMMGHLPKTAYLANPYVPFQGNDPKKYGAKRGLIRGTLFPGLDLPFMGMVNTREKPDTPKHELMALGFAMTELTEYLDTHPKDTEAAELLRSYTELYRVGKEKYEKLYGPLTQMGAVCKGSYAWVEGPWPWEYRDNGEA